LTRAVILKSASNICCSSLRAGDGMSCKPPVRSGSYSRLRESRVTRNERCTTCFLEHGKLRDEHLVDDVHDAVVGDHVRLKHMPTIDLDAFSDSGGYRV